jgi:hypothetical protein
MFTRKVLVLGVLVCALLTPSAYAVQWQDQEGLVPKVIRLIQHFAPWLGHSPTDDWPVQPHP